MRLHVRADGAWRSLGPAQPLYRDRPGGRRELYALRCDVDIVVVGKVAGRETRHVLPLVVVRRGHRWVNALCPKEQYRATSD